MHKSISVLTTKSKVINADEQASLADADGSNLIESTADHTCHSHLFILKTLGLQKNDPRYAVCSDIRT